MPAKNPYPTAWSVWDKAAAVMTAITVFVAIATVNTELFWASIPIGSATLVLWCIGFLTQRRMWGEYRNSILQDEEDRT